MSQPPLASILINNHNYGKFVGDAIESTLSQTYPHCEVIVVDDGSTDESREIIRQHQSKITPIFQDNQGQAVAINKSFLKSQGKYIFLLDSDDLFMPSKIEKIVEIFEVNSDIGWCFHPMLMVDENGEEIPNLKETYTGNSGIYDLTTSMRSGKLAGLLPIQGVATSALCFRRSFLKELLPMPESMSFEGLRVTSDNYLKYASFGLAKGYILLELMTHQRVHGSNAYTMRQGIPELRLDMDIMTAYWLRRRFPALSTFSHNLFAFALSQGRNISEIPPRVNRLIRQYRESLTWREKLFITFKRIYYSLKS